MKFSASSNSSDDDELNSSRLENYTGVHVTIVQSCQHLLNIYNCCEEFPELLKDKLNDACITDHKDFDVLCLHKSVFTKQCVFSNSCYIHGFY